MPLRPPSCDRKRGLRSQRTEEDARELRFLPPSAPFFSLNLVELHLFPQLGFLYRVRTVWSQSSINDELDEGLHRLGKGCPLPSSYEEQALGGPFILVSNFHQDLFDLCELDLIEVATSHMKK